MSHLSRLKRFYQNPRLAPIKAWNIYQRKVVKSGLNILDEDWDNLIILDGCRYDLFEECNTLDGELSPIISKGSHTSEFLKNTFSGAKLYDTVYITATPQVKRHGIDQTVHECIHVWEDNWNDDVKSVLPETMVDKALEAHSEHSNKRLIIHFLQPHYPFIGSAGQKIQHRTITGGGILGEEDGDSIWERLEKGELKQSTVWDAYKENLELTLPHVRRLLSELDGKSVVTSDHGNSFGEYGIYGHPAGKFIPCLVTVPWLVVPASQRRRITEGRELWSDADSTEMTEVDERLQDLGYK